MTNRRNLRKYSLDAFERLDIAGADAAAAKALVRELEADVARCARGETGAEDFEELIRELNALGHSFRPAKSSPGWTSYSQTTNNGTRGFFIHVERGEMMSTMVLYHETIETTVAKRRASLSPRDRKKFDIEQEFSKRGLALNTGKSAYKSL